MASSNSETYQDWSRSATVSSWVGSIVTCVILEILMLITHPIVAIDDAFISYRYALNLVRTGELVYNAGERVEGATNLLWMLILAGINWITCVNIEVIALLLSTLLFLYMVIRCHQFLISVGISFMTSFIIVIIIFALPDVFLTMINGLEAALYGVLLLELLFSVYAKRPMLASIIVGLLFMTRPEGAIVGLILLCPLISSSNERATLARLLVPAFLIITSVTIWRLVYFGAWIPNSIVDKSFPVSMMPEVLWSMSIPYVLNFVCVDASLALIIGLVSIVFVVQVARGSMDMKDHQTKLLMMNGSVILISFLITMRNGGDWMPHYRLINQYVPCYCLAFGLMYRRVVTMPRSGYAALTVLVSLSGAIIVSNSRCCALSVEVEPQSGIFRDAARRLASVVGPSDVVSVEAAGLLPYRLISTRIHDPIGLMDRYIARHGVPAIPYGKIDIGYTFETIRPSFMVWHWAGHIFQASEDARSRYAALCFSQCDQRNGAAVILIRKDRMTPEVENAFKSWSPWPYLNT